MTPGEFRDARATLGLTQTQLAKVMGLSSYKTVSYIETEDRPPHPAVVRLMQAYLSEWRPPDWPHEPTTKPQSNISTKEPHK